MAITRAPFGRTGHLSSRVIFGAAALGKVSQDAADRTLDLLLSHGINHIDAAASYGDAELRIAPWLKRHPKEFFIATKTGARRANEAREQLHQSLDRLGVDHVDLWQLHNLADPIEWDHALSPGGALETAIEAKKHGLVRFIGVTGHGAQIAATHRRSVARFDFDSVLLPYSYVMMQNPYYAENFNALYADCIAKNRAIQTIKSIAYRPLMGRAATASTWYDPLSDPRDITLAVQWAMGQPGIFINSVGDVGLLPHFLAAAEKFERRTSDAQMSEMEARLQMEPLFV